MSAVVIVLLILLAVGIVLSPLLRMRAWLKKSPPTPEFPTPPPDELPE